MKVFPRWIKCQRSRERKREIEWYTKYTQQYESIKIQDAILPRLGWLSWLEHPPITEGCGFHPQSGQHILRLRNAPQPRRGYVQPQVQCITSLVWECMGGYPLVLLSHIDVSLSPFLSLSKSNEKMSSGEDFLKSTMLSERSYTKVHTVCVHFASVP